MKKTNADLSNKRIFSNNLKRYLQSSGKTQKEVAIAINVSPSNFCDWLNLRSYPRVDRIQALADYFGIKKADLVEEPSDAAVTNEDQEVIDLFHQVPKEKREFVLSMIRAAIDKL